MGDRAMLKIVDGNEPPLYVYTHWNGTELPEMVRRVMLSTEAKNRIGDGPYLARIVFCRLVTENGASLQESLSETGWGLSTYETDGEVSVVLDVNTGKVTRQ